MTNNTQTSGHFNYYLKHRGETIEEQIKLNQPAMEWLKKCIEEQITEEEAQTRQEDLERFKQIVNSF